MTNIRATITIAAVLLAASVYFGMHTIAEANRYQVVAVDGAVLRIDKKTARAWRCQAKADGSLFWNYIPETERGILPASSDR
jgi:hypothetical protein